MLPKYPSAVLMNAAGGESGGGGSPPADEPPKYVTIEQFNEQLNKALGSRDKRFESKITEMFGGFGKSVEAQLAALAPKPHDAEHDPKGGGKVDPEFVKLKQTTDALTKRLEAETKRREDAETKQRSQRAVGELQSSLAKAGFLPEALETLTKAFRSDITYDDDGNPMLPFEDGATSIDAAISAWSKSDAAKIFRPAPGTGGAGTQRGLNGSSANQGWKSKARAQWTEADRDAYQAHRTAENARNAT